MNLKKILVWILRITVLIILFNPIWGLGSIAVADHFPSTPSEPGLVDDLTALLILNTLHTLLIIGLIVSSRWRGWRLAMALALAYYGSVTFITQVETWYFLSEITVSPELLLGIFIMGLPIPFLFIPLAVLVCGRWKGKTTVNENLNMVMPKKQLILKLGVIAVIYVGLYWLAGYYIAWQNPELRAFYGSPGELVPFWDHTFYTLKNTPDLFILQLLRGLLFAVIAIPVIRGSNVKPWPTAFLVALLLAVPHLGHIMANPLMPNASVRFSHMIETAPSTFLFGCIIVWLLHRRHHGLKDLLR